MAEMAAKSLPTLGHAVVVWLTASQRLISKSIHRAESEVQHALADAWKKGEGSLESIKLPPADSPFTLTAGWNAERWWLDDCSLISSPHTWKCLRWMLHLPALRERWILELRGSRFEMLIKAVPPAWLITDEATPPGAVIAGLDAPTWAAAVEMATNSSRFRVSDTQWLTENLSPEQQVTATYMVAADNRIELI